MNRKPPHVIRREGTEGFALTVHEVAKAFRARIDERFRPLGLSKSTLSVIGALACNQKPMSQRELAEAIFVEGPSLVRLLDRLEATGWVKREAVPGDRRMKHVLLTEKAEPYLEELIRTAIGLEKEILEDVPEEHIQLTHRVLLHVRDRLSRVTPDMGSPSDQAGE
ncbi:MAG: MarR family transcriptional regulator [Desulfovibrio sp.]|jgi:MarR family transcriptional regulator for hemolysin|nr:MarR family transcriptional regulator [Desulfovibrio sp.]MBI4958915.1 MarR family transcriptional regulator [Desulfovibrio sp.]